MARAFRCSARQLRNMLRPLSEIPRHCRSVLKAKYANLPGQRQELQGHDENGHAVSSGPRDGRATVHTDSGSLTRYSDDGRFDGLEKVGVNPWGGNDNRDEVKRQLEYQSGELESISVGIGKYKPSRCAIWNTVATDESESGRDGMSMNSPRAGGRYFISGSAEALAASRDDHVEA